MKELSFTYQIHRSDRKTIAIRITPEGQGRSAVPGG